MASVSDPRRTGRDSGALILKGNKIIKTNRFLHLARSHLFCDPYHKIECKITLQQLLLPVYQKSSLHEE